MNATTEKNPASQASNSTRHANPLERELGQCFRVIGSAMEPRISSGDLVHVSDRTPENGDWALVEFQAGNRFVR